ncbi:hypothetical protein MBR34_005559, partial [Klebsiella pneumoniae]|nr:hypothetical protein [Klebsiella pneumoniae]
MMSYLRPGDADRQGGGPAFFYQTAGCISDHGRALLAGKMLALGTGTVGVMAASAPGIVLAGVAVF